jgi:hypothetical protein
MRTHNFLKNSLRNMGRQTKSTIIPISFSTAEET